MSAVRECAQDVRYAVAGLRRNPLFALAAVGMLTLGTTAVTAVFSIVDAVLLRPSTFIRPESVVQIEQWDPEQQWVAIPPKAYARLRERRDVFSEVNAKRRGLMTITRVPVPDQMFGEAVSGNLFSLVAAKPLYGRMLAQSDELASASPVVLLSYHAWQQLFAGDPHVVGRTAEVDGRSTIVIGVTQEDFVMPGRSADVWLPLRLTSAELSDEDATWVETLARLRPNLKVEAAQASLDVLSASLKRDGGPKGDRLRLRASRWQTEDRPTRDLILWLAMGTVIGLLAIGCANVSSLLLARGLTRRRDYAIRMATGASQARLVRQSFVEALVLSFTGLVLGLIVSSGIIHFLRESLDVRALGIVDIAHAKIDFRVATFGFFASTLAALLSAGLPVWLSATVDLSEGLRESGTQTVTGHRARRLMFCLTGVQAGICLTLLLVSGLLVSSLMRLKNDDHGIQADRVLTMRLPFGSWFPAARTPEERLKQTRRYLNLLDQVLSVKGVVSAALSSSLPLSNVSVSTRLQRPAESGSADHSLMLVRTRSVTRDYFRVMGIPLTAGQVFRPSDGVAQPKVVIINQAFGDQYFHGKNPVGQFLQGENGTELEQIIGVIRNTAQLDLNQPAEPELFVSFEQSLLTPFLTGLVVRTVSSPEEVAADLRASILQADPSLPVVRVQTLQSLINSNIALSRSSAWILSMFALVALTLSSAGIYGVVTFATLARYRDFGIRLCLGSTRTGIFRLAVSQALMPICIGTAAGLTAAWFCGRALAAVLYKATAFDVLPAVSSVLVLLALAFAAAAIPALRSARIDPARTLRNDSL